MQRLRISLFLVAIAAGLFTACSPSKQPETQADSKSKPACYRVFFDQTGSVPAEERSRWGSLFASDIASCLSSGDRLEVYGIHDLTSESAPIYSDEMPLLPANAKLGEIAEYRKQLRSKRKAAVTLAKNALEGNRSQPKTTSILGVIDLHKPDLSKRTTRMIIFSDMLESAESVLNLERMPLARQNQKVLIDKVVKKRGWNETTLKGVEIFCLVRSYKAGEKQPVNGRRTLESFWKDLFARLGARVVSFNTYFVAAPAKRQTVP